MALRKLGPSGEGDVALPWDAIKEALDHMAESSAGYVTKENFLVFWDSLQVENVFIQTRMSSWSLGSVLMVLLLFLLLCLLLSGMCERPTPEDGGRTV